MRPACVSSPKSTKICELPKVFLAKRRNICVSPTLAVLDAAVGHIGPIGHIGRRLTPLCTAPRLSPRRGALFSVAVEGLALRACTLRSLFSGARQRPLVLRVLCDSQNTLAVLVEVWKLRGLEAWLFQRLHPSRACRALRSLFSVLRSPGRVSAPWSFVVLRVSPAGQTFHTLPAASSVARLPRALCSLFSVHCSLGRRCRPSRSPGRFSAHRRPLCYTMM